MTTLLLVRHSQTARVPAVDAYDWVLSAEGRRRCMYVAAALTRWNPARIVSSEEPKARETARITGAILNRPVSTLPGLQEQDRRGGKYLPLEQFHAGISALFARPDELVFGRETGRAAAERFAAALDTIAAAGETTAVVTHGSVLTLFLAAQGLVDPIPFWRALGQPALLIISWPNPTLIHLQQQLTTCTP